MGIDAETLWCHYFFSSTETRKRRGIMQIGTMKIGYARTSTVEQVAGVEAQERELRAAGAEKIFSERVSSIAKREQLESAIEFCRHGDVLVVTKLDRLARSMTHFAAIT